MVDSRVSSSQDDSSCEDSISLHRGVSFTPSVPLPHYPPLSSSPQGAAIHQNAILPITLTPPYITLTHPPLFLLSPKPLPGTPLQCISYRANNTFFRIQSSSRGVYNYMLPVACTLNKHNCIQLCYSSAQSQIVCRMRYCHLSTVLTTAVLCSTVVLSACRHSLKNASICSNCFYFLVFFLISL